MSDLVRAPIARLTFPEAEELADLFAVRQDLYFVEQACDRLCSASATRSKILFFNAVTSLLR